MNRTHALAALTLSLGLALTGCGGDEADDSGDGGEESSISRDDFVTQANEICAEGNAAIAEAGSTVDPEDPEAVTAFVIDTLVPNVAQQLADIRALGFPDDDADELSGIFDDADAALEEIEADPTAGASGEPFAGVNTQLNDYGLTECGSA